MVRRAKIVCTIGPASEKREVLRDLVAAGMDVARLNFSHGRPGEHAERAAVIRELAAEAGRAVALLQDLQGPKIRTGVTVPPSVTDGARVDLVEGAEGSADAIAIDYEGLVDDVKVGDPILLADGHVELRVESVERDRVVAVVEHGGSLRSRMGVNLPSKRVRLSAITEKDRGDLRHGLEMGVDYVALSFVRTAEDVLALRRLCEDAGRPTPIIAKIETPSAVANIDSIVQAADAVMVARGDLGVELPPEVVPVVQKRIIGTCRLHLRPVIVATEMLQSMTHAPRPTRAESSDVANAVFDGADAVMLSAETAAGDHPIAACDMMARIIAEAERSDFYSPPPSEPGDETPEAIARAACHVARDIGARAIVALTESGDTARLVSKARPMAPIVALSPDAKTLRRLALYWGVLPRTEPVVSDPDELVRRVGALLLAQKLIARSERFVLVYGAPVGMRGATNSIRVERIA